MFTEGLRQLGLDVNGPAGRERPLLQQFLRYRQELLDWNTRMNLTAITDPGEVLIKHFLDSLSLLIVYDRPGTRLLDIGAGAGFPGLPLKIARPRRQVGAVLKDDVAVALPGLEDGRRLLVWEQVRKCPAQFPRSGTAMAKKPLGEV